MSVPLRTLAERASAEITPRHAALAELDGLLPPGTPRRAVLEIADPGNASITRREFLGVLLG